MAFIYHHMPRPKVYKLKGSFGSLNHTKVYYLGFKEQPKFLHNSGHGFAGLKHLLENLKTRFKKFILTFTPDQNKVIKEGSIYKVRLSAKAVKAFGQKRWKANRELNLKLSGEMLSEVFPKYFTDYKPPIAYQKGVLAKMFGTSFDSRMLSPEDSAALTKLLTSSLLSGSSKAVDIPTVYKSTKGTQLLYLQRLISEFETEVAKSHDEPWWQNYFEKKILYFHNSYIRQISKINVTVVGTKFPDFSVVTSDGYLDVIEIKKPATNLLKKDTSRNNYYWSIEIAKAISQVENYIDAVERHADTIRNILRDDHGIELRIIRPRGIVIAGRLSELAGVSKKTDDFRRLNTGLKHVQIVPYDELSQYLKNTIVSIEKLTDSNKAKTKKRKKRV